MTHKHDPAYEGSDYHQHLMDVAYDLYQTHSDQWNYVKFISRLSYPHKVAVLVGNLNYQVENGGFDQWEVNGYSAHSDELITILNDIGTETAVEVVQLIKRFLGDGDQVDTTSDYYKINHQLMKDVSQYLWTLRPGTTHT